MRANTNNTKHNRIYLVSKALPDHHERWNWTDGLEPEEVHGARVNRTREELRRAMTANNFALEGTVQERLRLKKYMDAFNQGSYRKSYLYGGWMRLRPARRLFPLP